MPSFVWALIGAVIRIFAQGKRRSLFEFISNIVVSTFSGMMAYFLCLGFDVNTGLTSAITGLSGWAGVEFIKFLIDTVKKVLERKIDSL